MKIMENEKTVRLVKVRRRLIDFMAITGLLFMVLVVAGFLWSALFMMTIELGLILGITMQTVRIYFSKKKGENDG